MSEIVVIKVESYKDGDGSSRERLLIDGEDVMYVGPLWECPEDATLERDLKGPSDFVQLLKDLLAEHNGKKIKFEYEEVEEF